MNYNINKDRFPCPSCRRKDSVRVIFSDDLSGRSRMKCEACKTSSKTFNNPVDAIEYWVEQYK